MVKKVDIILKKYLIKKQPLFAKLDDEEVTHLADLLEEHSYRPGDIIVKKDDPIDSIFLIVSGTANVIFPSIDNDAANMQAVAKIGRGQFVDLLDVNPIAKLGPQEAIGLSATGLFSQTGKRTATVIAKTEVIVLRLRIYEFKSFVNENPHIGEVVYKNMQDIAQK